MLPPRLAQIKKQIEKKSQYLRSEEEKDLLEELEFLDEHYRVRKIFEEDWKKGTRVFSGPADNCPCCGK